MAETVLTEPTMIDRDTLLVGRGRRVWSHGGRLRFAQQGARVGQAGDVSDSDYGRRSPCSGMLAFARSVSSAPTRTAACRRSASVGR
jgi:hypothetical protein